MHFELNFPCGISSANFILCMWISSCPMVTCWRKKIIISYSSIFLSTLIAVALVHFTFFSELCETVPQLTDICFFIYFLYYGQWIFSNKNLVISFSCLKLKNEVLWFWVKYKYLSMAHTCCLFSHTCVLCYNYNFSMPCVPLSVLCLFRCCFLFL